MTLVVREDLTQRTALSKSELMTAHYCAIQSHFQRTMRRPWPVSPDMTFGSALDAAVEQVLTAARADIPISEARALQAAAEISERDECLVDLDEITNAIDQFIVTVLPTEDWHYCGLQLSLTAEIEGIGPVNGHPDIRLADGSILDVKAGKTAKRADDVLFRPELPLYAALQEAATGDRPPRVGYLTWVRRKAKPEWQTLIVPVTDDLIAEGLTEARRQVHQRRMSDLVSAKGYDPGEWFSGPKFAGKCSDCAYLDVCSVGARRVRALGGVNDAAA